MVSGDHRQLIVWQLADALRTETLRLTRAPGLAIDFRLRREIEETVSSICRNIPEGYRRRRNREFARFLEYAYSSSGELTSLFDDLVALRLATPSDLRQARSLGFRLDRALRGLIRHCRRYPDRGAPDH